MIIPSELVQLLTFLKQLKDSTNIYVSTHSSFETSLQFTYVW